MQVFVPGLRLRIRRELLAGFHHQRSIKVIGLLACRNVQLTIRIEIRLKNLRPYFRSDRNGFELPVIVRPCFGPGFRARFGGVQRGE